MSIVVKQRQSAQSQRHHHLNDFSAGVDDREFWVLDENIAPEVAAIRDANTSFQRHKDDILAAFKALADRNA